MLIDGCMRMWTIWAATALRMSHQDRLVMTTQQGSSGMKVSALYNSPPMKHIRCWD